MKFQTSNFQFQMPALTVRRSLPVLLAILGICILEWSPPALADAPERVLRNGTLTVSVMDPAHPGRYHRGVRFTPLALVLGVERDGVQYLYAPEPHDADTDGGGLAAEFDLCLPNGPDGDLPPNYTEANVGGGFLKIGVGVLRKEARRYSLFQQPELLEPLTVSATWHSDRAEFFQSCAGATLPGYAYELGATVSLDGGTLAVEWRLANTGEKPFTTRQYAHNFFRVANHGATAGYVLSFPYDFAARGLEHGQRQEGRDIVFFGEIPRWINATVTPPADGDAPNRLELRLANSRLGIVCETSLPALRTDIHARNDYIAPEQFVEITLQPNEQKIWKRHYTFNH